MLGPAVAVELQQPVAPSSSGVVANPPVGNVANGCVPLGPASAIVAAHLIVRNSSRPDVGPYTVTLPGYATNADPSTDRYAPFIIEAPAGDTLRIDLTDQLDASAPENLINLHTHGLVVSPRPNEPCAPTGDYIFDTVSPGQTERYRIDIPATVNGVFGPGPQPYPAGLYWFHSHVHGSARDQIRAGQAGLIAIDPPSGSANTNPAGAAANVKSRYLALRDIQLSVPHGKTPDLAASAGQQAAWIIGDSFDTQACRGASNPGIQMLGGANYGYCGHVGIYGANGTIADKTHDTVWLFTVNGQYEPDITIAPGGAEIWRIANLSATATYVLSLTDAAGTPQDVQLLTLDGVVAGSAPSAGQSQTQSGLTLKRILLMPASRAEIMVPNTANHGADVSLTLRTEGIETGGVQAASVNRTNYAGDPWPPISLAHVVMKGSTTSALTSVTAAMRPLVPAPGEAAVGAVPANCITMPGPNYRRRITFAQTATDFRIGSEVVDALGRSADGNASVSPHTIAAAVFDHGSAPDSVPHLCAPLGSVEVWELVNTTNELHNFHIHQTKFRLARAGDAGAPPGLTAATAVQDPGHVVINQIPEFANPQSVDGVDVWHDTIPIPPTDAKGIPGVVFIAIPFTDPVQIGTFVFHCHILEHEDGGMMAAFEVYDPRRTAQATPIQRSARINGTPFCGHVPPGFDISAELQTAAELRTSAELRSSDALDGFARRLSQSATLIRDWLSVPSASQ